MKILILGGGVMAVGMANNLARQHDVTVLSRFLESGGWAFEVIHDLDSLGEGPYAAVMSCVADDHRSRELWSDQRLQTLVQRDRPVTIELSTLSPKWVREWHQYMASLGAVSVESPVTGSRSGARDGTLSCFCFYSESNVIAEELLTVIGSRVYRFSEPGNPTVFKLIYNSWGAAILATLGPHADMLAEYLPEDFDVAAKIVTSDGWMSSVARSKLGRYCASDFGDPDFKMELMIKDLTYLGQLNGDSDARLAQIRQEYERVMDASTAALDFSVVTRGGQPGA